MARAFIGNFKGPKGDKGETGAQGKQGNTGATGQRGSRWTEGTAITGTSTTAIVFSGTGIADALVNDMYLNTSTSNVYRCTVGGTASVAKWVFVGCIKGAKGDKGDKGATGATGPQGPRGEQGPSGTNLTVDTALSSTSTNPVQNKVINETLNTLKKSVSDGKTKVANAITDKGVKTATDATFDVMAKNISKIETGGGELHGATLAISTSDSELFGKTVTLTLSGNNVATTVLANNGKCSFVVQNPGTYTITCGEAHKDATVTSDNVLNKTVISVNLSLLKIVTFADGTDAEIAKMIQAHYNNKIKISDYWSVGDMRTVHLSAMAATGVGESHRAQDVQFVIGDFDHDDLSTPINGHSKAALTLLQKDCLMDATNASDPVHGSANTEAGYMGSSNSNWTGWFHCARRAWCNDVYFKALPTTWQSIVKTVVKKTSAGGNRKDINTTQDKIFLASEIEILNTSYHSFSGEGEQYQYYKNAAANKYKMPKWYSGDESSSYFTRSPASGNTTSFASIEDGIGNTKASIDIGIAPNLCI